MQQGPGAWGTGLMTSAGTSPASCRPWAAWASLRSGSGARTAAWGQGKRRAECGVSHTAVPRSFSFQILPEVGCPPSPVMGHWHQVGLLGLCSPAPSTAPLGPEADPAPISPHASPQSSSHHRSASRGLAWRGWVHTLRGLQCLASLTLQKAPRFVALPWQVSVLPHGGQAF